MKEKTQTLFEFYLFVIGAGLMGYGLRLNYVGNSVLKVVGFWFAGVLVFSMPWILWGETEKSLNSLKLKELIE